MMQWRLRKSTWVQRKVREMWWQDFQQRVYRWRLYIVLHHPLCQMTCNTSARLIFTRIRFRVRFRLYCFPVPANIAVVIQLIVMLRQLVVSYINVINILNTIELMQFIITKPHINIIEIVNIVALKSRVLCVRSGVGNIAVVTFFWINVRTSCRTSPQWGMWSCLLSQRRSFRQTHYQLHREHTHF